MKEYSKGYTINYFIKFFTDLKSSQIGTQAQMTKKKLTATALLNDQRTKVWCGRNSAFSDVLFGYGVAVSEGHYRFSELGKTPRTRILTALKLRKQKKFDPVSYF